jgi:hypothetical protein
MLAIATKGDVYTSNDVCKGTDFVGVPSGRLYTDVCISPFTRVDGVTNGYLRVTWETSSEQTVFYDLDLRWWIPLGSSDGRPIVNLLVMARDASSNVLHNTKEKLGPSIVLPMVRELRRMAIETIKNLK